MLDSLHLRNVGPAAELALEFGSRLNLLTGDNGLGKSFLLDVAWWALTRRWPQDINANLTSGYAARPTNPGEPASISLELESQGGRVRYESPWVGADQAWKGKAGRPWNPGLVIYALADGGFAVWDPARNYWKKRGNIDVQDRLPAYVFSPKAVWEGLRVPIEREPTLVCNGLLADWTSWIREGGADAARMAAVLAELAPDGDGESLRPGTEFARLSVNDVRDIPTIQTGYGRSVPIVHASMGVRRITALAYMLTWAWREHIIACKQLGQEPSSRLIMLVDEIEAHLHPRWQRVIVPSLLSVVHALTGEAGASVQLIAATHSPLVLASVESSFDAERDAWFDLDLVDRAVVLQKRPYVRRGEVGNWLTSEAFDLGEPRSLQAELAIQAARELMRQAEPAAERVREVDTAIKAAGLPDIDPFWVRWRWFTERAQERQDGAGA